MYLHCAFKGQQKYIILKTVYNFLLMSKDKNTTVETSINASIDKVWNYWTHPDHIKEWNNASDDWHTPKVENDLKEGGRFVYRMEAKDGSVGFDFGGTYSAVQPKEHLAYTLDDDRNVSIAFEGDGDQTKIIEIFAPESENSIEMQKQGWQAILDNFKQYVEK